jgi:hypothetical protein
VRTLSPGAYTIILRDHDAQYGVGLVEVYNLDGLSNEKSRLLNISTRCLVGTGDNQAIAGTIVVNDSNVCDPPDRRVLTFGKGPSLACQPGSNNPCVANPLPDPQIELHMTADAAGNPMNVALGSNDQYSSIGEALTDELADAQFAPTNLNESALWPTLRPGFYTTILSGKNNSEGVAVVEFYEY